MLASISMSRVSPRGKFPWRTVACLIIGLAWAPAWAQGYSAFNDDTLYGSLRKGDSASFDKAVAQVLNDPQEGKVLNWQGESQRPPTTAQLRAMGAHEQQGMPCRDMHARLQRGKAQENWKFIFCRQSDGQWKIASQQRQ